MAKPAAPVNVAEKLAKFDERWSPRIVAEANGWFVKVVKVDGEFVWHQHDESDELFLVVTGELTIELEGREEVVLRDGDLFVVPKRVRHRPVADGECHVLLLEPEGVVNTGDATGDLTADDEWI